MKRIWRLRRNRNSQNFRFFGRRGFGSAFFYKIIYQQLHKIELVQINLVVIQLNLAIIYIILAVIQINLSVIQINLAVIQMNLAEIYINLVAI